MKIDIVDITSESLTSLYKSKTVLYLAAAAAVVQAVLYLGNANFALAIVLGIASFFVMPLIFGSVFAAKINPKLDAKGAFNKIKKNYVNLILTTILGGIIIFLGFVALVIPGIYLAIRLCIGAVIAAIEGLGPVDSLKKSWKITSGKWWPIFGTLLLTGIIVVILDGIFAVVTVPIGLGIIGALASGFFGTALSVAAVLLYQELK